MKTYQVTLNITGTMCLQVQADNEEEAIAAAREQCTIDDCEGWHPTEEGDEAEECVEPS